MTDWLYVLSPLLIFICYMVYRCTGASREIDRAIKDQFNETGSQG